MRFGRKLQAAPRGPIAGPWRAALSQTRGDWAFYTEVSEMERKYTNVLAMPRFGHRAPLSLYGSPRGGRVERYFVYTRLVHALSPR